MNYKRAIAQQAGQRERRLARFLSSMSLAAARVTFGVRRLGNWQIMKALDRKVCPRKFWTHTDRPLPDVAELLLSNGVVVSANHDSENVYEWLECQLECGTVELNVSRQHRDGEIDESEPLAFILIGTDTSAMTAMVDQIANLVESICQLPVTIGAIEHLGGDDFRFVPSVE